MLLSSKHKYCPAYFLHDYDLTLFEQLPNNMFYFKQQYIQKINPLKSALNQSQSQKVNLNNSSFRTVCYNVRIPGIFSTATIFLTSSQKGVTLQNTSLKSSARFFTVSFRPFQTFISPCYFSCSLGANQHVYNQSVFM